MKYEDLTSRFFFSLFLLSLLYIFFCIFAGDGSKSENVIFSKKLISKLDSVKELDANEKTQIQLKINDTINETPKIKNIIKKSVSGAIRGGISGGMMGGVEGAVAGGIVFGCISPVIEMLENFV